MGADCPWTTAATAISVCLSLLSSGTSRPTEPISVTPWDKHLSARKRRPSMAHRKKRRIGAFSRRLSLSDLDLRTNAGKFANSIKESLEAQIGKPTAGQQILIKLVPPSMPHFGRRAVDSHAVGRQLLLQSCPGPVVPVS